VLECLRRCAKGLRPPAKTGGGPIEKLTTPTSPALEWERRGFRGPHCPDKASEPKRSHSTIRLLKVIVGSGSSARSSGSARRHLVCRDGCSCVIEGGDGDDGVGWWVGAEGADEGLVEKLKMRRLATMR